MFILYDNKMNKIEYPKGVTPLDIFISSINKERETTRVEGVDGSVDYGSTFENREIELKLLMEARDTEDYRLLRNAVYAMFQKEDSFFVSEAYEQGKRYLISVDQSFIPERVPNNQRYAEATVICTKLGLPFAESIGTTFDIQNKGINANDNLWGYGMGLQSIDETLNYTHSTRSFEIYNAGNVPIHPFQQDLKISILGAGEGFQLRNRSTGDLFRLTDQIDGAIAVDGANITDNGLPALRKTNRKFITLAPGWNNFTQNGTARISFDFRFYYL